MENKLVAASVYAHIYIICMYTYKQNKVPNLDPDMN